MIEAEQAIIASCLVSAESFERISESLEPGDFVDPACNTIYRAITAMRDRGVDVDPVTLGAVLERSDRWSSELGDPVQFLTALGSVGGTYRSTQAYVEIIRNHAMARRLRFVAGELSEISNEGTDADTQAGKALSLMDSLIEQKNEGFATYAEASNDAIKEIIYRVENRGQVSGLSTGFHDLDELTSGLQKSELIILAGRPSMGKTVLAMNIANNAASSGKKVLVFSLEMAKSQLAMRTFASLGDIHFTDIRNGNLDDEAINRLYGVKSRMNKMDLLIDDRGGISVDQLRTRARVAARKSKPDLIVVDYLTLLKGQGESRTVEIGYVSRSLKALAKELECPVLCLAQLNRGVDSRNDKRPTMSDLRDSGEIEQDADLILFNYLHEKYDHESPRKGILELIIGKQRNGDTGSLFLTWQANHQRFQNHAGPIPPMSAESEKSAQPRLKQVVNDYNNSRPF